MVIMSHWEQATNRINKWQRRNEEVKKERKTMLFFMYVFVCVYEWV